MPSNQRIFHDLTTSQPRNSLVHNLEKSKRVSCHSLILVWLKTMCWLVSFRDAGRWILLLLLLSASERAYFPKHWTTTYSDKDLTCAGLKSKIKTDLKMKRLLPSTYCCQYALIGMFQLIVRKWNFYWILRCWPQCCVTSCADLNRKVIELLKADGEADAACERYNFLYMNASTRAHTRAVKRER